MKIMQLIGLCLLVLTLTVQDVQGGCQTCSRLVKHTYRGWWTWYTLEFYDCRCSVDGGWSAYSAIRWSGVCSTTCGPGIETGRSTRKCNNPVPAHGGRACRGLSYRLSQRPCKLTECPIDGGWSDYGEFSEWSACSATCEKGTQSREQSRTCTNPEPKFGGKYCVGDTTNVEVRSCDMKKCPDTICQERRDEEHVHTAHLQICTSYIQCKKGVAHVKPCSEGTMWDDKKQTCDHPTEDNSCMKLLECKTGDHIPHETDRRKYFVCAHNKPEERTCEDGLVWNDDINNCDHDKGAEDPTAFECSSAGLFQVLDEPSQYYNCYYNGQKYVFVKMPCPPGTVFDDTTNACIIES